MELNIDELKLLVLNKPVLEIKESLNHFDIKSFDKNGNNILHYFLKSGASEQVNAESIVHLFINAGIDINAKQVKMPQRTALQLSVIKKLKYAFDMLLREGADINIQDGDGNVALFQAVMNYRGEDGYFIETLISKGAHTDLKNKFGVTPKGLSDIIANYNSKDFFNS